MSSDGQESAMGNLRKCFGKSEMSKASRVHSRIFCDVQCTWQSAGDGMQKEAECCSCGTCRRLSEKDETTVNLTQVDSRATVKFLQVGSTFTQINGRCVMVLH